MNSNQNQKAIILFDGVCNFCNSSVNFIIKHDTKDHFRFTPLQSEKAKTLLQEFNENETGLDSIVLIENNKLYKRSTASLKITKQLRRPYSLLYLFIIIPSFLRDPIYNFIAKNRYKWFGKKDVCMIPTPAVKDKFIF